MKSFVDTLRYQRLKTAIVSTIAHGGSFRTGESVKGYWLNIQLPETPTKPRRSRQIAARLSLDQLLILVSFIEEARQIPIDRKKAA